MMNYILYVTVNGDGLGIQSQPYRRTGHTRWHDELGLLLEQQLAVCCHVCYPSWNSRPQDNSNRFVLSFHG